MQVRNRIQDIQENIRIREQPDRISLYLHDADILLNRYHIASAEYTEQVRLLKAKLQYLDGLPADRANDLRERIETELLSLSRAFCHLDNILSRKFIQTLCPEKKLIRIKGSSPTDSPDENRADLCALCDGRMEVSEIS